MPIHEGVVEGHPTITLAAGGIEATFLPGLGMLCGSLLHEGEQLLDFPGGISAYEERKTVGIPFLHPWANRLAGFEYEAAGQRVQLDPRSPLLQLDEDGLPLHGLVSASPYWTVTEAEGARLKAELDFAAHDEYLEAFPYPHRVELEPSVAPDGLTMRTTVTPTSDGPVPISFGFHPYFRLPGARREEWEVELPVTRHLEVDEHGIPTGRAEAVSYPRMRLGERGFDDLYAVAGEGATFVLAAAGRDLRVSFEKGYAYTQVYAPPGSGFVCLEPMTAPTNALVSGDGLRTVTEPFSAVFSVRFSNG
jgi:aldose 1-epimerase